jgi:hypothetical protein
LPSLVLPLVLPWDRTEDFWWFPLGFMLPCAQIKYDNMSSNLTTLALQFHSRIS